MLSLAAHDYRLDIDPARGGAILGFSWRGAPLMRPVCGPSILDTACFALVPFSNRIMYGRFVADGREVRIAPNFPGSLHPHPLHGFGWLSSWAVLEADAAHCLLEHCYPGGEWPWPYSARQLFQLDGEGLTMSLEIANDSDKPMPAGLGFHPYFVRDEDTLYEGLHKGEWQTGSDGLPLSLDLRSAPIDWWGGKPVGTRSLDTVYTGREGPLRITWPSRAMALRITPSSSLDHTVIYTPRSADFFCVEPVSHRTDAINSSDGLGAMTWLSPSQAFRADMRLEAVALAGESSAILDRERHGAV